MPANRALALLIAAGAILFAIGVTLEKGESQDESGSESATVIESEESPVEGESEGGEAHAESSPEGSEDGEEGEEAETLLGIDVESTPLIVLAVLGSFGLAAAVWLRPDLAAILFLAAAAMLAFAVLDVREAAAKFDESETAIGLLAALVALLHGTAAVLGFRLAGRRPGAT